MDSELLQILAEGTVDAARVLFLMASNTWAAIEFLKLILKKKHSYRLLYCYLVCKFVLYHWLYLQILGVYVLDFEQVWIVHTAVTVFQYILLISVFCYTFYGSLMKVILSVTLVEPLGGIVGCGAQLILNFLEGRENVLDLSGNILLPDILLPVFCYVIFKAIQKLGNKAFEWLREREVKHPRLWGTFYVIYLLISLSSVYGFDYREMSIVLLELMLLMLVLLACIVLLGISIFRTYQRQVVQKNRFLKKQQELIFLHSRSIQKQVLQTERLQKQLDEQMEKILSDAGSTGFNERIRSYLTQLKEQYQTVETGMYCRDWMVDAVLSYMVPKLREKGVVCELHFQNYDRGNIESVDMAQLMMQLMNLKILSNVRIRAGRMATGVFIELISPDIGKKRVIEKAVRPLLEKYHGEVWQGKEKEKHTFLLRFPVS